MTVVKLQSTILRAASLITPREDRAGWLKEWHSELWYTPRRANLLFCMGAFRDALWVRWNSAESKFDGTTRATTEYRRSPLFCLALLATLGAISLFIAVRLLNFDAAFANFDLRVRDLPAFCLGSFFFSSLLLPRAAVVAWVRTNDYSLPWHSRLRRCIFLILKIALVQPIMTGGFVLTVSVQPVAPLAPAGFIMACVLAFRWILTDQQQRCPVCLQLLDKPVRVGTASKTFLEWYRVESMCVRGHGLLLVSETSTSFSRRAQWLGLDSDWKSLFCRH
jgi:hypothetical protein